MATKVGGDGGGDASASGCSSSCVAARKFAAVAGKVTRAVPASKAMFDLLAVEARPWDEHVRAAVEAGSDAPARVRALQAIGGLADVRGNRAAMWQDSAEQGTREVLLCAAAEAQPDKVRERALGALASLGCDEANQQAMWQSEALVSAVLAAAAGSQPEAVRRAALWLVWNLSLDHPTNRRLMWADGTPGGVRELLLLSAAEG